MNEQQGNGLVVLVLLVCGLVLCGLLGSVGSIGPGIVRIGQAVEGAAPAVQGGSTAAAPLRIPADAWSVTVAWTPTPGPTPVPPTEMHWTDGHTGQPCSWTAATGVVCGGP